MPDNSAVDRKGNVLHLASLTDSFVVGNFIRAVYEASQRGYEDIFLDFGSATGAFPNVCAPVAGLVDYYKTIGALDVNATNLPEFIERIGLLNPVRVVDAETSLKTSPLNTVWKYSLAEEVNSLVHAFLNAISKSAVCEPGVIQGLEWAINEVLDNVLQHADTEFGFVMGQIHRSSRHIAVCVYDHGRGIYNSLRNGLYEPRTALDAITLSIQEGVTRDKDVGQGNGMWGLHNIVRANSGRLGITSGSGYYRTEPGGGPPVTSQKIPFLSRENHCTSVGFQLDFDKPIKVSEALGGYDPQNFRVEELEDTAGNIVFRLADKSSGTGTRRSGEAIRTEVINLSREANKLIVLDFEGVAVISSSFADEFIGKLVADVGFIAFTQRFRLKNMNDFVEGITNRAVVQRMQNGGQLPH